MNKPVFYESVRDQFNTRLSSIQVEGFEALLDAGMHLLIPQHAYTLATVWHETDKTMQSIEEYGKGFGKDYGRKLKYGKGPGKRVPYSLPDKLYYGRGHTQNTWYEIYEKLTKAAMKQGKMWDFLHHPELLLQMEQSVWATYYAMGVGLYTGKPLGHYISALGVDYINARRVINGLDKAELIAGYAVKFEKALNS